MFRKSWLQISALRLTILIEVDTDVSQFLQENFGTWGNVLMRLWAD
jgi:hypothetical protein